MEADFHFVQLNLSRNSRRIKGVSAFPSHTANYRSVRRYTLAAAICDGGIGVGILREIRLAEGGDDQDREHRQEVRQEAHEAEAREVGALHVLEDEDDRALACLARQIQCGALEELEANALGGSLGRGGGSPRTCGPGLDDRER